MFHYTTVAYRTLAFSENAASTFQNEIPREALARPYFLRQLLAFSGFHLAHLHPEKKTSYLLQASKHQSLAVRGIREALAGPISATNCHSLYATAVFIVLSKFAAFPSCEDYQLHGCSKPIEALIENFFLVSGLDAIIHSPEGIHIRNGPLKELFAKCADGHTPTSLFLGIQECLPELRSRIASEPLLDTKTRLIITSAIDSFVTCLEHLRTRLDVCAPPELQALFWWPMLVSRDFLDLAGSSHPLALVILSYHSVLLFWAESEYWLFEGWSKSLIRAITDKLWGSPWEDLVSWPVKVIVHSE